MKKWVIVWIVLAGLLVPETAKAQELPLGILGPMEEEIADLLKGMQVEETRQIGRMTFYRGKLHGQEIVLVQSGIGKVNAAASAQAMLDYFHVRALVNTGIAATLRDTYKPGDIVISEDVVQHDVDGTGIKEEPGTIPRLGVRFFKADPALIAAAQRAGTALEAGHVYVGRIATGDQFIDNIAFKQRIARQYSADAVEMEGGAIAHVAYLNHVPFVIVRAIADDATGIAPEEYDKLIALASKQSTRMVEEMLQVLGGEEQ